MHSLQLQDSSRTQSITGFLSWVYDLRFLLLCPLLRVQADRPDVGHMRVFPANCFHWGRLHPEQLEKDHTSDFGYG